MRPPAKWRASRYAFWIYDEADLDGVGEVAAVAAMDVEEMLLDGTELIADEDRVLADTNRPPLLGGLW
jgi:hypothetical protein